MNNFLAILTLCSSVSLVAMEQSENKTLLQKMNELTTYNDYILSQIRAHSANSTCLIDTYYALNHLFQLEQKFPKARPTERCMWQKPQFVHWLTWYKKKVQTVIQNTAQNEYYYNNDTTILHLTILRKNSNALLFALNSGIKPSLCKISTLLNVKNIKTAKLLLEHGEDINKTGAIHNHVLTNCARKDHSVDLLKFYLANYADGSYKDSKGTCIIRRGNVLHLWCSGPRDINPEYLEKIQLLIHVGISLNDTNYFERTPLDEVLDDPCCAINPGAQQLIRLLRKYGAKTAAELALAENVNPDVLSPNVYDDLCQAIAISPNYSAELLESRLRQRPPAETDVGNRLLKMLAFFSNDYQTEDELSILEKKTKLCMDQIEVDHDGFKANHQLIYSRNTLMRKMCEIAKIQHDEHPGKGSELVMKLLTSHGNNA